MARSGSLKDEEVKHVLGCSHPVKVSVYSSEGVFIHKKCLICDQQLPAPLLQ